MAGLSCGEPSSIAWDVLENAAQGFMAIPEHLVAPTVRMLAKGQSGDRGIDVGESAVAGFIGLICGATNASLREKLQLDCNARVVIIGSEGVTDPEVFQSIMEERL